MKSIIGFMFVFFVVVSSKTILFTNDIGHCRHCMQFADLYKRTWGAENEPIVRPDYTHWFRMATNASCNAGYYRKYLPVHTVGCCGDVYRPELCNDFWKENRKSFEVMHEALYTYATSEEVCQKYVEAKFEVKSGQCQPWMRDDHLFVSCDETNPCLEGNCCFEGFCGSDC